MYFRCLFTYISNINYLWNQFWNASCNIYVYVKINDRMVCFCLAHYITLIWHILAYGIEYLTLSLWFYTYLYNLRPPFLGIEIMRDIAVLLWTSQFCCTQFYVDFTVERTCRVCNRLYASIVSINYFLVDFFYGLRTGMQCFIFSVLWLLYF